jgi:site-specific DNA-cytosine methylase
MLKASVLTAVDLCCGAGGWACAARGLPIHFVAVADIDENSLETWKINHHASHPDCAIACADLSLPGGRVHLADICGQRQIDLVLGGIPCEQVSLARNNAKLAPDAIPTLHRLIDGIFGLVAQWNPAWWAIEDVLQIVPHLPGDLIFGRPIPIRRIDARHFGPQRRKRVFLGVFPKRLECEPTPRTLGEVLRPGPYRTCAGVQSKRRSKRSAYSSDVIRIWDAAEAAYTVTSLHDRHSKAAMIETTTVPRTLEWQEAAVLQGFPEDFIFVGSVGRASKMIAQAISIHVGRAILQAVCREHARATALSTPGAATC